MWLEELKELGVNIHVIATGAGAGIQQNLWSMPGSSAYLSGCSFPYSTEETAELLGFTPENFCSEETAVDLAAAAYMKAYKFGGKKPVGVGMTATVASEKEHRGDNRIHACIITNDDVRTYSLKLEKKIGWDSRLSDGFTADDMFISILTDTLGLHCPAEIEHLEHNKAVDLAKIRFFKRPFFTANGKRLAELPHNDKKYYPYHPYALMPGAFNPPHEGHFGTADAMLIDYGKSVVFEVTAEPPHKEFLTVQQLLQRAKLLQGRDRIFTRKEPLYIDKARSFNGISLVVGADAMLRMLDPKWGVDPQKLLAELNSYHTKLYLVGREIDGKFITINDIIKGLTPNQAALFHYMVMPINGKWDVSSTELRSKLL